MKSGAMKMSPFFYFFIGLLISQSTLGMSLPRNLTVPDQKRALEILGFGTAGKLLDNPYPLGGYSGLEIGLATEYVPIDDLSTLGDTTPDKGELNYYTLTLGKGLYYNIDTQLYFTPFVQGDDSVSNFGGHVRWGFYEAVFFPISFSAMLSAGGSNFSNLINVSTIGADLLATVNIENLALYFGGGRVRAIGTFIGGADGITADQKTVEQDIVEDHSLFGVNIRFDKMFVAFEIDRYTDSVYSGKIGLRF
jgi:hypothetical protein